MMTRCWVFPILITGLWIACISSPVQLRADSKVEFTDQEIRRLLQHTPLPSPPIDPTNRYSADPKAAQLGQYLFFDPRLSINGKISCATCHDPAKAFADGKPLSEGMQKGTRHTPSLWNSAYNRWFFWDGRADSLWAQALHPLESSVEMGSSRAGIARVLYSDDKLKAAYEKIFGKLPADLGAPRASQQSKSPPHSDNSNSGFKHPDMNDATTRVFVNLSKAIAAYTRHLASRRAPFDVFVEGLRENNEKKKAAIPDSAQRGAKLFIGKANCRLCHSGPNFTDNEFHDTRVPPLDGRQPKDPGRFGGIPILLADPFNAAGPFSDDSSEKIRANIEFLTNVQENWGRFKTPTLRNVALTAPYMHQGQFATLKDVIHYYSTLDRALPPGHHQETILKPLNLSEQESKDLLAFLHALTDDKIDPALVTPPKNP